MPRNAPHRALTLIALAATLLIGCTTARYDGKRPADPNKAIIVGSITEGFLTQPHGLTVDIERIGEPSETIRLETLGNENDQTSRNLRGYLFMYEVPVGQYQFSKWRYQFYAGHSAAQPKPAVFSLKAGEIAYIGDLYANALVFCLSNTDHQDKTLEALRSKYPMLKDRVIRNITSQSAFAPWPSSDAEDTGKGLCKF
ncbi:hypothetical protein RZO07_13880 [Pseudomonas protegens]|uniref:hypothetical protein n=1 Tax=Pseudomonas chlororaphis group TaxID=136842 RepID=UPI001C8D0CD6|nr:MULTISPECIES: hypothetical protein [Pseudomonas chlororaphis group]MCO7579868.1 hypothetical protein [Pseudomonas protegens]MCO7585914.1 hypothetical protein [Pseudomonas chlororaphis]MCO7603064.1 hypothetical protein [Pseudomonas chlororaphis]QZI68153.1 hypothetical protein K5F93_17085 [Pseudomonas protegens]WOE82254.1 hypothetical protein RZO07_13880 [Pseudomonas protegens]